MQNNEKSMYVGRRVTVCVRPLMYVKTDMRVCKFCLCALCLCACVLHVFVPLPNRKTDLGFIFVM